MKQVNYLKVDLSCMYQQVDDIENNQCLNGIISRKEDGSFKFEEAIRKGRAPRNPKLYDGTYISMVRMQNGKYQFHMKTLSDDFDKQNFPFAIYNEITDALKFIG